MVQVVKREGESASGLIYRFTKKMQQSGVLKEAKKRRFYHRGESKLRRQRSAIRRTVRKVEIEQKKKWGLA